MIDWSLVPDHATTENLKAMKVLDERGLKFCVHFGYGNAATVLREMDEAIEAGNLFDYMAYQLGTNDNHYTDWKDHGEKEATA